VPQKQRAFVIIDDEGGGGEVAGHGGKDRQANEAKKGRMSVYDSRS